MAGKILVLDDDNDMREILGEALRTICCRDFIAVGSLAELVALGARALECELAILDINLGGDSPSGLDAYRWLTENGFEGRVVFLTGHARSHPLVDRALRLGAARVYEKPIRVDQLLGLVGGRGP